MKKSLNPIARFALMLASTAPWKLIVPVFFLAIVFAFGAGQVQAATVIVGTCKSGTQFTTIQLALDASPAPDTVQVCPGTYPEQVAITHPVTLEGIAASNADQVHIVPPAGGLTVNATVNDELPAAAQIYVKNVNGTVNVSDLYVDGSQNNVGHDVALVIGVLYLDSSGSINHVATFNQEGGAGGIGIYMLGGSNKPTVTVENCSVHDFDLTGILGIGTTETPNLTLTMKNNFVSSLTDQTFGIDAEFGSSATITNNVSSGGGFGIYVLAAAGSVTNNVVGGAQFGIELGADGASVKSNRIYGVRLAGINLDVPLKVSEIQGNTITNSESAGIDLNCHSTGSPNRVHSNTLTDVITGYVSALAGFSGSNTYEGVPEEIDLTTCISGDALPKVNAATVLAKSPHGSRQL
jgi:Right handed beta helix region